MPDPEKPDDRGASESTATGNLADEASDFESAFEEAQSAEEAKENPDNEDSDKKQESESKAKETEAKSDDKKDDAVSASAEAGNKKEKSPEDRRYDTLKGILDTESANFKKDRESWEKEKAQLKTDIDALKKASEEAVKAGKTKEEKDELELTEEEQEQLKVYEDEFASIAKGESIKRRTDLAALRKEMKEFFSDVLKRIEDTKAQIEPAVQKVNESVKRDELKGHFDIIKAGYSREDGTKVSGHPDFEKYRDNGQLSKWIESKPGYLKSALLATCKSGSAADVIDLLSDFKKENNISVESDKADSENEDSTDDNKVVDINSRKAEKKAALAAVHTKKSAVNTAAAESHSYESAFDEALKKSGG